MANKRVYLFREGDKDMKDLLGGKGANLAEMSNIGLPVPPGFTVTTEVCTEYYEQGKRLPAGLIDEVKTAMADVEKDLGKKFGDPADPLLVSVRSGAKFSMPGMMDTILNLGLNKDTIEGIIKISGNERFAYDSYRRFIMMFSDVVLDIEKHNFEHIFDETKKAKGVKMDTDLNAADLKEVCSKFLALVKERSGKDFPSDPYEQLAGATEAVFRSWNNDRAIVYRRTEKIPDEIGTAVNIQAMVFGNLGDDCGTGVAFTRDPSTGEDYLYGDYLMNAQGEDVVAGIRTPEPISELERQNSRVYKEFHDIGRKLESHYKDMMDLEFTIERDRLFMLQCRAGKRTGLAAVRIAVEMVEQGLIGKDDALMQVKDSHIDQLFHKRFDSDDLRAKRAKRVATGISASPGAAVGIAIFDSDRAAKVGNDQPVILVRDETNPDDVHGMLASKGVLTARGGKASHAAVVARGFGIPCVTGCEALAVNLAERNLLVGGFTIEEGDWISIDGGTGEVYSEKIKLIDPEIPQQFYTLMDWADSFRKLGVRTNADNPRDAKQAVDFGAEGIGLCRTEHMFFEPGRLPIVQEMILAKDDDDDARQHALNRLLVTQQQDFEGIFEVMDGRPVTIRLIDPPLHEFLPNFEELIRKTTELEVKISYGKTELAEELKQEMAMLHAVELRKESNPMLGLRGVRLSIIFPGIVLMQTRAILQAAAKVIKSGKQVKPEIMIPLVSTVNELRVVQNQLEAEAKKIVQEQGIDIPYLFGTMIELPRAALTAAEIAEYAQFFSFGTNDLTQTTFGFSRDDAEGKFLQRYVEQKILTVNPFETIDRAGVGRLMKIAVTEGRQARPSLKCGICGEHGGDPNSIYFCHELGLDYVSCSPFRVPIARLAAAQAAIKDRVAVAAK